MSILFNDYRIGKYTIVSGPDPDRRLAVMNRIRTNVPDDYIKANIKSYKALGKEDHAVIFLEYPENGKTPFETVLMMDSFNESIKDFENVYVVVLTGDTDVLGFIQYSTDDLVVYMTDNSSPDLAYAECGISCNQLWKYFNQSIEYINRLAGETPSIACLKKLWKQFDVIPIKDNVALEQPFLHFEVGTSRFDVWHWFDEQLPSYMSLSELIALTEKKEM